MLIGFNKVNQNMQNSNQPFSNRIYSQSSRFGIKARVTKWWNLAHQGLHPGGLYFSQNRMWMCLPVLKNLPITHSLVYHWKAPNFVQIGCFFTIFCSKYNLCNLGSFISNENSPITIPNFTKTTPKGGHMYVYHVNVRTRTLSFKQASVKPSHPSISFNSKMATVWIVLLHLNFIPLWEWTRGHNGSLCACRVQLRLFVVVLGTTTADWQQPVRFSPA